MQPIERRWNESGRDLTLGVVCTPRETNVAWLDAGASVMLMRWGMESTYDQPYHTIEAVAVAIGGQDKGRQSEPKLDKAVAARL